MLLQFTFKSPRNLPRITHEQIFGGGGGGGLHPHTVATVL
jgi:hypothetical protein